MAVVRSLLLPLFLFILSFSLTSLPLPQDDALLKLKQSFHLESQARLSSWAPNTSACSAKWVGVYCNNNSVIGLHLSNLALSGTIDVDALLYLPALRTIGFINNSFSGPIPHLNKLGALKAIFLTTNQFSGPIPSDFFATFASIKKIWLAGNKFSGNIPASLGKLKLLAELHLEDNEFSGPIPPLHQHLRALNLSNNKLEGAIPNSLDRFGIASFSGNQGLCGKVVGKECDQDQGQREIQHVIDTSEKQKGWVRIVIILIMAIMVVMLILVLIRSAKSHEGQGARNKQYTRDEVVQVHVPSSNHSRASSGSTTSKKQQLGAGGSKRNGMGDLVMVNQEKGVFGLPDLMKAAAEVLGNGGMGSAYKATMGNGLSVVVKRIREINKISRDIFDAEMRQFGRIQHPNILPPLSYHYRKEEKLIVSQYIPKGSLLYVLHGDRGTCHADLNWPTRLNIVRGIATGLSFLHSEFGSHDLPHGNLKSSNVLLSDNYEPLLIDYAFHPLINPNCVAQALFAYKSPDYIQYQQVSHKTDVYCLGIIILEIMTGKFPSQYHNNGKGGTDVVQWVLTAISEGREVDLIDPEIKNNVDTNSLSPILQLLQIGASCTETNPEQRLSLGEAIRRIEEIQV